MRKVCKQYFLSFLMAMALVLVPFVAEAVAPSSKSAKIEKAWQEKDLKNYTILVHSLKSMSRIVGANSLADLSFQLEIAGKEENASLIEEKTPQLLELYRGMQEPLDEILEEWEDG